MRVFLQEAQEKGEMDCGLNLDYVTWMMQTPIDACGKHELMSMFPNRRATTRQGSQTLVYGIMPVKRDLCC